MAAVPSLASLPVLVVVHVGLGFFAVIPRRDAIPLGLTQGLVLSLWTTAPLLIGLAPLRLLEKASIIPAVLAILLGHLLVWRDLRVGSDTAR
jgi:hypothetical protein